MYSSFNYKMNFVIIIFLKMRLVNNLMVYIENDIISLFNITSIMY